MGGKNQYLRCVFALYVVAGTAATQTYAATLAENAVYNMQVLVEGDANLVGTCSAFTFGDATTVCGGTAGPLVDNTVTTAPALSGGDGVNGDGFAGVITITTGKSDANGDIAFTVDAYQMDPYLNTAGGIFKITMTPPDGSASYNSVTAGGVVTPAGDMTLDLSGRVGVAQFFEDPVSSIGIQPWNIHDARTDPSANPLFVNPTDLYEPFVTGTSSNANPADGTTQDSATGRAIGDANGDGVLDAILVSYGNVGQSWQAFAGTPYSEIYNVQFQLVDAFPVANVETLSTTFSTNLIININTDLLANDTHAQGQALTFQSFTQPANTNSSITDNGDGTLTYTPDAALAGGDTDSFTYTVQDADGNTDTATVTINIVSGVPPVAVDDAVNTQEDASVVFDPVANDTDADTPVGSLTVAAFDAVSANAGSVTASGNNLTYQPAADFNGVDTFTYTVQDPQGNQDVGTVTVTVAAVNDPPVCSNLPTPGNTLVTAVDTQITLTASTDILANCTDVDSPATALTLVAFDAATAQGGSVSSDGAADPTLTYTPPSGFTGNDTFTYMVSDGADNDVARTVTVSVADPLFSNFTMLDPQGNTFGGTNDVEFEWDFTTFNTDESDSNFQGIKLATSTPTPFFGAVWTAHDIRIFGPGTYTFDTTCLPSDYANGVTDCNRPLDVGNGQTEQYISMTVGAGQIGAHILFDYNGNNNIDVVVVWDQNAAWDRLGGTGDKNRLFTGPGGLAPDENTTWRLVSTDGDGDGIVGFPMVDGPFIGYNANFNIEPLTAGAALPDFDETAPATKLKGGVVGIGTLLGLILSGLLARIACRRRS